MQKISDLRAALGGGADQGILSPAFENGVYVSSHPLSTALALHCPKACSPPLPLNTSYCISGLLSGFRESAARNGANDCALLPALSRSLKHATDAGAKTHE